METVAEKKVEAPKAKKRPTLMPERIGLAEHRRNDWVVDAPVGVTVDDLLEPAYWALCTQDMQPNDNVQVRSDDGKWIAYLIVRQVERAFAKMYLDRVIEFKENAETLPPSLKHRVEFKGNHLKHAVIRNSDDAVLQSGFKAREDAEAWLRSHERSQ